jgi:hypothetical protein
VCLSIASSRSLNSLFIRKPRLLGAIPRRSWSGASPNLQTATAGMSRSFPGNDKSFGPNSILLSVKRNLFTAKNLGRLTFGKLGALEAMPTSPSEISYTEEIRRRWDASCVCSGSYQINQAICRPSYLPAQISPNEPSDQPRR